ncbi:glutamine amidotransferase [Ruminiclostridium sufflavum DSM 19573]|uniref:Imidazole glycerol phosphate synthase subunit HisH n=1 Tax=Ruminiclostridium sufflavum DSM 19573 TaxID=1121337 RepID=A0A318XKS9_9FIRM|nr:imidazole glycerol phosphate synthase subunit HisH [Ruminiclostridium sufflavum]PYG88133.1 glutamine amidotransferase [Ruminiclostridium sufflavum DSM 19573]
MIAIIDYGVGNLASVNKALSFIGFESVITSDYSEILAADKIVLPGVGAFADAMESLEKFNMIPVINEATAEGTPLLGICLGMQLLFDYSTEGGEKVKGLGLLKGGVTQFPLDMGLKVPHMGWNSLDIKKNDGIFKGIKENSYVYFVHSYCLSAQEASDVAATCSYGIKFDAAVSRDNIMGTQFHPEKSGDVGLNILRNFASL